MQTSPQWLALAHKEMGVEEVDGPKSNPRIMAYFATVPGSGWVKDDSTPWCGAFTSFLMHSAGCKLPEEPLRARSWLDWGEPLKDPVPGCVVVFKRPPDPKSGHVALFQQWSEDRNWLYVLGGNQGDRVSIARYPAKDVLGYRWPSNAPPATVTTSALAKVSRIAAEGKQLVQVGFGTVAVGAADKTGVIPKPPKEAVDALAAGSEWTSFIVGIKSFAAFVTDHWMIIGGAAAVIAGIRIIRWRREDAATGKTWSF